MTDFPSDFEREARHHERAVDEYRYHVDLTAEVARLTADRAALIHRLEALLDRWRQDRAALVRQAEEDARSEHPSQANVEADLLLGCIDGLERAISGDEREVNP